MRRWAGGLWLTVVALVTLLPGDRGTAGVGFACLPCGDEGVADGILNLLLFAPLGVLFEAAGRGWVGSAGAGLAVSGLVELLQTGIPGRFPTAADLVFNTGGAVLGWWVARRFRAGHPRAWEGIVLAVGAMALTAVLAVPTPPPGELYGQHTPTLGTAPVYPGLVLEARIGGVPVGDGLLADGDAVRRGLAERRPVDVRLRVGPPPSDWSPVFAVFSGDQEEAVFVAARGEDLRVRFRSRGGALGLREPAMVRTGALGRRVGGDTVVVRVRPGSPGGWCIDVGDAGACGYGVGLLQGWRFLVGAGLPGGLPARAVSAAWLAVLLSLVWSSPSRRAFRWAGVGVILGVAAVLPLAGVVVAAPWTDLGVAVILGLWGGLWTVRSRWRKDLPIP